VGVSESRILFAEISESIDGVPTIMHKEAKEFLGISDHVSQLLQGMMQPIAADGGASNHWLWHKPR
jgi:hypothetical protein